MLLGEEGQPLLVPDSLSPLDPDRTIADKPAKGSLCGVPAMPLYPSCLHGAELGKSGKGGVARETLGP